MRNLVLAAAAALAATTALAGCTVSLPQPAVPEKPGFPWADADGDLWVVRLVPCSFGIGTAEEACNDLTALYRDGSILHITYGEGGPDQVEGVPHDEGDRRGLTFASADLGTEHADEIMAIWQATRGADPDHVRVHALQALRIDPTEREDALRVVDLALQQAKPLPDATFDCQDCTAPVYWAFGSPKALAQQRFGSPPPGSDAWTLVEDQMATLRLWTAGPGTT